ncbi:DUF5688 family protein [Lachnospiraceae bacterium 62-35]
MVYETFLQNVQQAVAGRLGSSFAVFLQQVSKNNGVLSDSLCIRKLPSPVAAAIYLRQFFDEYESGTSLSGIVSEIINLYTGHSLPPSFEPEQFLSLSSSASHLACRLINTAENHSFLETIPHIPFLDLSIVFYLFTENEDEVFTSLVSNGLLSQWNLTVNDLFFQAHQNSMAMLPPVLRDLADAVEEILQDSSLSFCQESTVTPHVCHADTTMNESKGPASLQQMHTECKNSILAPYGQRSECAPLPRESETFTARQGKNIPPNCPPIHILTNTKGINGAYCMLYPGILKSFAEAVDNDLIIIPSSIHEVLLIPGDPSSSSQDMDELVQEINQNEVPKEEQLSSHTYLYSRLSDRIFLPSGISSKIPGIYPTT